MVNPGHAEVTFINKADAARWHCWRITDTNPSCNPGPWRSTTTDSWTGSLWNAQWLEPTSRETSTYELISSTIFPCSAAATTGGATMALPKMEYPAGKERKGPAPDMDSIHRWCGFHFVPMFFVFRLKIADIFWPEPCSTRSLLLGRSKPSQSRCPRRRKMNRIDGRWQVTRTMNRI